MPELYSRGRKGKFAIWTWEAQDSIQDPLAFVVYLTLKRFADFNTGENCYVSDAVAAKVAGVSIRTFAAKRELLKSLGWVTWESGQKNGTTNLYKIHETLEGYAPVAEGSAINAEGYAPNADPGYAPVADNQETLYRPRDNNQEPSPINASVREIYDYWAKTLGYTDRKLTDSRKKHIKARLADGFTVEQLKSVVDYVKNDPTQWWRGKNDRNTPYDDIQHLYRNTERVERFLSKLSKNKQSNKMVVTDEDRQRVKGTWIKE